MRGRLPYPDAKQSRCFGAAAGAAIAVALLCPSATAQVSSAFVVAPYLQMLSSSEVTVRFETPAPCTGSIEISCASSPKRSVAESASARFHSMRVDALQPSTAYSYLVRCSDSSSQPASFETAPSEPTRPFSFVVYGDSRSNASVHAAIVRQIQAQDGAFLVGTGDIVTSGSDLASWLSFFATEQPLLRSRCLFCAIGNHELEHGGAHTTFARYFATSTPAEGSSAAYFTFRWGNTRFFVLDSNDTFDAQQGGWLRSELQKADSEAGLVHRMISTHQSPFSSGPHGPCKAMLRAAIPALLSQHRVELIVAGHDHVYERGEVSGLKYIVSGGAGAPLYPLGPSAPGAQRAASAHHYVHVKVDADRVSITAYELGGAILDQCSYRSGQPWSCEAAPAAGPTLPLAASAVPSAPAAAPTARSPQTRCGCTVPGADQTPGRAAAIAVAGGLAFGLRRTRRANTHRGARAR
jgi:acid phosphatase type 7